MLAKLGLVEILQEDAEEGAKYGTVMAMKETGTQNIHYYIANKAKFDSFDRVHLVTWLI